jgi:hypothetical protein
MNSVLGEEQEEKHKHKKQRKTNFKKVSSI